MELRVLRYFLAVAREESISAAAEMLHLTQPTLSRQLMELEAELGVQLLHRGKRNRGVTLTDAGMLLRRRAEEIVALAEKTEAEIQSTDELVSGDVHIGGGESDAMRLVAKAAKTLYEAYPLIRLHLYSGNADDVTERLDQGLLDFGIVIEPASVEKYHHIQLPVRDVWGLLMRRDSPLAQKETVRPEDLDGLPLLASRQTLVNNVVSGLGYDFGQLHIVATYNLVFNASLMVEEGFGYAFCLDQLVNTSGDSRLCFRPFSPRMEASLSLVWKKYAVLSKAAEKFLATMQELIHSAGT